jgi:hypothetical protein
MSLEEDITYPTKDKDWIIKIVIGGILTIIPIVNFLSLGYMLKTMKNTINEEPELPRWTGFGNLFVKGLGMFVISFVYMLVPLIIVAGSIVVWGVGEGLSETATEPFKLFAAGAVIGFVIAAIVAIIIGFFMPMAFAMYAKSGRIGRAFAFGEIMRRIRSVFGEYIRAYLVIILLAVILFIISLIPVIGWLVAMFGWFYVYLVAAHIFGKAYLHSTI